MILRVYRFQKENVTCIQLDSYLIMHLKFMDPSLPCLQAFSFDRNGWLDMT